VLSYKFWLIPKILYLFIYLITNENLLKKGKVLQSIQAVYIGSSHKPKTHATTKTPSTQPTHQAHHPETHETTKPKFQPVLEIFGKLW
jgi:hypothetical protein